MNLAANHFDSASDGESTEMVTPTAPGRSFWRGFFRSFALVTSLWLSLLGLLTVVTGSVAAAKAALNGQAILVTHAQISPTAERSEVPTEKIPANTIEVTFQSLHIRGTDLKSLLGRCSCENKTKFPVSIGFLQKKTVSIAGDLATSSGGRGLSFILHTNQGIYRLYLSRLNDQQVQARLDEASDGP